MKSATSPPQLPSVDFNFEDLRQRMSAFAVKFDAFIEKGQKRVLDERNEFHGRLGELAGTLVHQEFSFTLCFPFRLHSIVQGGNLIANHTF